MKLTLMMRLKLRFGDAARRLIRIPYKLRGFRARYFRTRVDEVFVDAAGGKARYDEDAVRARVDYYNKMDADFEVQNPLPIWQNRFMLRGRKRGGGQMYYTIDLSRLLAGMRIAGRRSRARMDILLGDITTIPAHPTIVRSRPIAGDNRHSILLKLNSMRHYRFARDPLPFEMKQDRAVWRGDLRVNARRREFVEKYGDHPRCNVAGTGRRRSGVRYLFGGAYMEISEQLRYKFIVSIEGVDVATNLPWILSSNSLCLMPAPRFETWFMEGRLEAGVHYVQLADDFADLEAKMEHYLARPDEAKRIVAGANRYAAQFFDQRREAYIGRRVLMKYFSQTGQWEA